MQVNKFASLLALAGLLAGCASLPTSGPTGGQIEKLIARPETQAQLPIHLSEVQAVGDLPPTPVAAASGSLAELPPPPTDMIGPGDILDITVYEAGVSLFAPGGASASGSAGAGGADLKTAQIASSPGVQSQKLPPTRVNDDGDIVIPYVGRLHVLGHTVGEVETMIRSALRGFSQNPQVVVAQLQIITNSVIVSGEVVRPGRLVLQTNRETLSDVVALAGGYRGTARDLMLRVSRRGENVDIYMNDLDDNPSLDVRAYPGDRLMLINNPRTFSVLGAPGRVEQIPFSRSRVSLAEAVAQSGGAAPNAGNAAAIFVFRYSTDPKGTETPVVYHINMMKPGAYFLAQRFAMRDKDVLYFGNAAANQPTKMMTLISQLFTPVMTVVAGINATQ
jgi:polysaccharide export outer membrane protein